MTEFTKKIVYFIKNIPEGKVLTYGRVAALAGNPKGARQVSWTLRTQTEKETLPWHRVIGSKGTISIKDDHGYKIQKDLLENEGVVFGLKDKIDLDEYMWDGMVVNDFAFFDSEEDLF